MRLKQVSADSRKTLSAKLPEKQKREGRKSIAEAERRRWELPETQWQDWEVPFQADPDWPPSLREALTAYRRRITRDGGVRDTRPSDEIVDNGSLP
jgi:adenine-specific DNA-methyltransferase